MPPPELAGGRPAHSEAAATQTEAPPCTPGDPRQPCTAILPGLTERDRLLVVAPHPDDETIGAAGLLARAASHGLPLEVVILTNGDGYPDALRNLGTTDLSPAAFLEMGRTRQAETRRALGDLGVRPEQVVFLGFPDDGLGSLWREHWSPDRVYRSPHTGAQHPPYADSPDAAAPYTGSQLTALLASIAARLRPTIVVLPHPGDVHPDHAAAADFTIEALDRLRAEQTLPDEPRLLAYLVHNPLWPDGDSAQRELVAPRPEWLRPAGAWWTLPLSDDEQRRKAAALRAHDTQMRLMSDLLGRFARRNELFAEIPASERARIAAEH